MGRPLSPTLENSTSVPQEDFSSHLLTDTNISIENCENSINKEVEMQPMDTNVVNPINHENNTEHISPTEGEVQVCMSDDFQDDIENGNKRSKLIIHGANGSRSDGIFVSATVLGKKTPLLVDTGASVTILGSKFISELGEENRPKMEPVDLELVAANGNEIPLMGECEIDFHIRNLVLPQKVLVADIEFNGVLGLDFMSTHCCDVLIPKMCLRIKGQDLPCFRLCTSAKPAYSRIAILEDITVPPESEFIVHCRAIDPISMDPKALVEPSCSFMENHELLVARTLVNPLLGEIPVRIMNLSDHEVKLHQHGIIGTIEEINDISSIQGEHFNNIVARTPSEKSREELPEHLQKCFVESTKDISVEQRDAFKNLLTKYGDIFSKSSQDMGLTDLAMHKIETGNARPIKQHPRRIPLAKTQDVEREIQDMLAKGVIEESDSPWSSPIVLVKKKDNTIRFCIDYRKLNEVTVRDSHPLPRIDTTLDALSGSKFYSTIDLKSGYWQVKVNPEDREKTAFSVPGGGHWNFVVMPFGLCNAGATFQRLMEKILSNLSWKICMVYLDDIIVLSKTFEEHLSNLEEVFGRLKTANLKERFFLGL